jgi:RND family efflux transporter MFP subunit
VTRRFIGQIEATRQIDIGFELGGRIIDVLPQEGDRVRRGDRLAHLDVSALQAQRAALAAERRALSADAELARLTLARTEQLSTRGFRSDAAVDDSRLAVSRLAARIEAVEAQIAGVDVQIDKSTITAPFDGQVGNRMVDPGQNIQAGAPVVRLFEEGGTHLRASLPTGLAAPLAPGDMVTVEIDGETLDGRILRLRPDLDPVTRTRDVIVALPEPVRPAFGQTASLVLQDRVTQPGFWAPVAALREGRRGSWELLTVASDEAGSRAAPLAVEVMHMDGERVFLRGTASESTRFIAGAPDRVAPGQKLAVILE